MFLLSLTATCQVCTVSLKAGLSTYNRFAPRALETPDADATQADPHIMGVARQAAAPATGGLMFQLHTEGQEESEHTFHKRLAIAQQLEVGRFILKIDGDGLDHIIGHFSISAADFEARAADRQSPISPQTWGAVSDQKTARLLSFRQGG